MNHSPLRILPILAIAIALGGCGAGGSNRAAVSTPTPQTVTATATATAAPTPTPTPSPTATAEARWSLKEAAVQYAALAEAGNVKQRALFKASDPNNRRLSEVKTACRGVADGDTVFLRGLATGKWPTVVQTHVDKLITEVGKDRTAADLCAKANDWATVEDAFAMARDATTGAGSAIRAVLGLPEPAPAG
jgi:hypothetical protein